MSKPTKSVGAKPPDERRSGKERRASEVPPSGIERRKTIEPRKPDVVELDLSESEWGKLDRPPGDGSPKEPGTGR